MVYKPKEELLAIDARLAGRSRTGTVDLRAFDEGVVRTLGGEIINDNYWLRLESVSPPPGLPGIPITFAVPEDVFEKHFIPAIIVRRDDITTDMSRWHPGLEQYGVPAEGALPVTIGSRTGFDRMETLSQPEPNDIMYTISILAKHRQGIGTRRELGAVFNHVLRTFMAYSQIVVEDSIGDLRTYETFREGVSVLDDLSEVSARTVGFAVSIRVEAELDLADPKVYRTVTKSPVFNFTRKE